MRVLLVDDHRLLLEALSSVLLANGIDVVGLNSLKYLWTPRSPDELARDIERIARHYMASWRKTDLILLGYSSGADILPFVPPRLSPGTLDRVLLVADGEALKMGAPLVAGARVKAKVLKHGRGEKVKPWPKPPVSSSAKRPPRS